MTLQWNNLFKNWRIPIRETSAAKKPAAVESTFRHSSRVITTTERKTNERTPDRERKEKGKVTSISSYRLFVDLQRVGHFHWRVNVLPIQNRHLLVQTAAADGRRVSRQNRHVVRCIQSFHDDVSLGLCWLNKRLQFTNCTHKHCVVLNVEIQHT